MQRDLGSSTHLHFLVLQKHKFRASSESHHFFRTPLGTRFIPATEKPLRAAPGETSRSRGHPPVPRTACTSSLFVPNLNPVIRKMVVRSTVDLKSERVTKTCETRGIQLFSARPVLQCQRVAKAVKGPPIMHQTDGVCDLCRFMPFRVGRL